MCNFNCMVYKAKTSQGNLRGQQVKNLIYGKLNITESLLVVNYQHNVGIVSDNKDKIMNTKAEYFTREQLYEFADGIPQELTQQNIWVGFHYRENPNNLSKKKKQPVCIEKILTGTIGAYSDTEKPENHCSFAKAMDALKDGVIDGIGIYLVNTDYTVIDIDGGVTYINDSPMHSPDVNKMLENFDSWAEYSSSGNGVHIFIKGQKSSKNLEYKYGQTGGEIYDGNDSRCFIAMTGCAIGDYTEIHKRQNILDEFCKAVWNIALSYPFVQKRKELFKSIDKSIEENRLSDDAIISKALEGNSSDNTARKNFYLLWTGKHLEKDASKYDLQLLSQLMFWTAKDREQAKRLFLQSPYVMDICESDVPVTEANFLKKRSKSISYFSNRLAKAEEFLGNNVYRANTTAHSNGENASVGDEEEVPTVEEILEIVIGVPPLPSYAQIDYTLGKDACPWLDEYITYSKKDATRSASTFHQAVGLWVLDTVVAGRLEGSVKGTESTNLYIMLLAPSTLYAKSTAAKVGKDLIGAAGLGGLLLANQQTPQAYIKSISTKAQEEKLLSDHMSEKDALRVQFPSQRGLYYDEFGNHLSEIMRRSSPMSAYLEIFKTFFDGDDEWSRDTITRGNEETIRPYLSLLCSTTPDDLKEFAGKDSKLWKDGTFARFVIITPEPDEKPSKARRTNEKLIFPNNLVHGLIDWHNRLGVPQINYALLRSIKEANKQGDDDNSNSERIGVKEVVEDLPINYLRFSGEAYDAFYNYMDGLRDIITDHKLDKLSSNYGRLAIICARIALIFASFANASEVELKHWAKAQEITEGWRELLHNAFDTLSNTDKTSAESEAEEKVKKVLKTGKLSRAEIKNLAFKNTLSENQLQILLDTMVKLETILKEETKRTVKYCLP